MKIFTLCIKNPRAVIAAFLGLCLAGIYSFLNAPMSAYPILGAPQINISNVYPGADASTVESAILSNLESALSGVGNVLSIESFANNRGASNITVTLSPESNQLESLIEIQNAVSLIETKLPQSAREQGVIVSKGGFMHLMSVNLLSNEKQFDRVFLSNYARQFLFDDLSKITGVTDVRIFGEMRRSLRIWIHPEKLFQYNLAVPDLIAAIRLQTGIRSIGRLNQPPTNKDVKYEIPITTETKSLNLEDFENILLHTSEHGRSITLKDVADIEIGAESYDELTKLDNMPTVVLGIFQNESGNAIKIAEDVKSVMNEKAKKFPEGVEYKVVYDTSSFVALAYNEVLIELLSACIIVVIVVLIFLRSLTSALLPALVIPISLLTTILVLSFFGYSINLIMFLGLIIATGIVVDDAILVIEKFHEVNRDKSLSPSEATLRTMKELVNPIVVTTIVLFACFVPLCLVPGAQGILFKQIAVVILISVSISAICALTLSPCITANFISLQHDESKKMDILGVIGTRFFETINRAIIFSIKRTGLSLITILIAGLIAVGLMNSLPKGFVPEEDEGYFYIIVLLPDSASLAATEKLMDKVTEISNSDAAIKSTLVVNGWNFIRGNGANNGIAFALMEDWNERESTDLSIRKTIDRLKSKLSVIEGAEILLFAPPTIPSLGSVDGFSFNIVDERTGSPEGLEKETRAFIKKIRELPEVGSADTAYHSNVPMYTTAIDLERLSTYKLDVSDVFDTLSTLFGSSYISDFNYQGVSTKIIAQADAKLRGSPDDIRNFYVRSRSGELVPLSRLMSMKMSQGPESASRFNGLRSATVSSTASPKYGVEDAIKAIERSEKFLSDGYKIVWSEQTLQMKEGSKKIIMLSCFALISIYIILMIIFNSWMLPFSIISTMSFAGAGSLLFIWLFNLKLDLYTAMGGILAIAMFVKSMILVISSAEKQIENKIAIEQAILSASKLRMRCISMTSIAFLAGIIPLAFSDGAGSGARQSIGISLIGGVLFMSTVGYIIFPAILGYTYKLSGLRLFNVK